MPLPLIPIALAGGGLLLWRAYKKSQAPLPSVPAGYAAPPAQAPAPAGFAPAAAVQSATSGFATTDVLANGSRMQMQSSPGVGDARNSPSGTYALVLQSNGDLILWKTGGKSLTQMTLADVV